MTINHVTWCSQLLIQLEFFCLFKISNVLFKIKILACVSKLIIAFACLFTLQKSPHTYYCPHVTIDCSIFALCKYKACMYISISTLFAHFSLVSGHYESQAQTLFLLLQLLATKKAPINHFICISSCLWTPQQWRAAFKDKDITAVKKIRLALEPSVIIPSLPTG